MYRAGRHMIGIFFILCVVLMWVGSSELMTWIYQGSDPAASFNKPFFLTYLDCSLFFIYLSGFFFKGEYAIAFFKGYLCTRLSVQEPDARSSSLLDEADQSVNSSLSTSSTALIDDEAAEEAHGHRDCTVQVWRCVGPNDRRTITDGIADFFCCRPEHPHAPTPIETCSWATCSPPAQGPTQSVTNGSSKDQPLWHGYQVAKIGVLIMPFFFIANWLFNASLSMTSVASNTILSSTSGIFTLFMGVLFRVDTFSLTKLIAVSVAFGGVVLVALSDSTSDTSQDSLMGDLLSLLSACTYASYALLMKKLIPDEHRVSLFMFFGFLGLSSLLLMWPLFPLLDVTSVEEFGWPTSTVWGFLMLNAFVGTVLSDVLWLASLLFTSPLVTTLGMTLSIPVAMVFDSLLWGDTYNSMYISGAILVLLGFILLNLDTPVLSPLFRKLSNRLWSASCQPGTLIRTQDALCPAPHED